MRVRMREFIELVTPWIQGTADGSGITVHDGVAGRPAPAGPTAPGFILTESRLRVESLAGTKKAKKRDADFAVSIPFLKASAQPLERLDGAQATLLAYPAVEMTREDWDSIEQEAQERFAREQAHG